MIIVDDKLSLDALASRKRRAAVATTWTFHYRLLRALTTGRHDGALADLVSDDVLETVLNPPSSRLVVLDPRDSTVAAAELAGRHRLNLLAADLFGAAVHHGATIRLSVPNVGREWASIAEAEGVRLEVVE